MKRLLALLVLVFGLQPLTHAQCDVNVREAFGGISAVSLYNTYITVGIIADNYSNETYDANRVVTFMDEQIGMIKSVSEMLSKCTKPTKTGLTADDCEYIKDMIKCLEYLQNEAQGLKNYVNSTADSDLTFYDTNRKKAWEMISKLLGLEN